MLRDIIYISCFLIFAQLSCTVSSEKPEAVAAIYLNHCGSCHLPPDPANIPKPMWEDKILPEMAARLGYHYNRYNPTAKVSMEEELYISMSHTYPEKPLIDSADWQKIHDYVLALAPDSIASDSTRGQRNLALTQFKPKSISLDKNSPVGVTDIGFEPSTRQLTIGSAQGKLYSWPGLTDVGLTFNSPVISNRQSGGDLFVTEIGYMNPSEKPLGILSRIRSGKTDTLASGLHRPVFTEVVDLDGDGQPEILVCEYGNLTGELSMLVQSGSGYEKRILLPFPGTIKVEIRDMNEDGKKDIVVLAAQGNEGIYVLYQKENLQFDATHVIRLEPEYGSSWFELLDYNGDNYPDIVLANGDNADYSNFLKPYHGVRLFLNDGKGAFAQKWFYPIYGATRVLANDYDQDGDIDFAVTAFFPDFENSQEESFVFLENKDPLQYRFEPHTLAAAKAGRWLSMEQGDFDQDGDTDIMLGSFLLPMNKNKFKSVLDRWRMEPTDLLLLENQLVR